MGSNQHSSQDQVRQVLHSNETPLRHVTFVGEEAILLEIALKEREDANNAYGDHGGEDFAFMAKETTSMLDMSKWIVDSGCTKHMTPYKCSFNTYEPIPATKVWLGDIGMVDAIGMGTIVVEVMVKGICKRITLKDVLHVPKMKKNLLSVNILLKVRSIEVVANGQ
jgi:hypothetical protein